MKYDYDYIIRPDFCAGLEYGIIEGTTRTVYFIKLPSTASVYGFRDKYCSLALKLRQTRASIIVATNLNEEASKVYDLKILEEYVSRKNIRRPKYRFIGIAEGAVWGLEYLKNQIGFDKMLLINMPMVNRLEKTVEILNRTNKDNLIFVYGDQDSSYCFASLLHRLHIRVDIVKDADHSFTGMSEELINLTNKFFKGDIQ